MLTVRPDFYDDFRCLAADCRHSCCVGWEIDVDADTLAYYRTLGGELGQALRENIDPAPTPHFRLGAEERCPFLREDGLCRIICELGEDGLCDICALHPRFFNDYPGRTELGLGLCCEEAARLLTEGEGPLCLIAASDGQGDETPSPLLKLREEIFRLLADGGRPLIQRMDDALALTGQRLPPFDPQSCAVFFLTLERMDGDWTALLNRLAAETAPVPEPEGTRDARIAAYLIYRHFAAAETEADAAARLQFCFLSVRLISALAAYSPDALRLFSAEIEYSDENMERVCRWLEKKTK